MSSWEIKLEKKLASLTDNASKESIQTVANWVAFNRKHCAIIASTLTKSLQNAHDNPKRQWLYWQLIHEILIADRDTPTKWEKLVDLRVALGERLIPAMEQLGNAMLTSAELSEFIKEWESSNAFGGPLLMSELKRLYQSRNNQSTSSPSDTKVVEVPAQPIATPIATVMTDEVATSSTADVTDKAESAIQDPEDGKSKIEVTPSKESVVNRRSSYSQNNNSIEYDFESKVRNQLLRIFAWVGILHC
jgi:hypothetical protein